MLVPIIAAVIWVQPPIIAADSPAAPNRDAVEEIAPVDGAVHAELAVARLVFVDHDLEAFRRIERTQIMLERDPIS